MKKHTQFLTGIFGIMLIFGLFLFTGCDDGGDDGPSTPSTPSTYTVTFYIGNGTGTVPAPRTVKAGSSITLPDGSGLTRDGYTFIGWYTSSGSSYNAGASFTPTGYNSDITLYADWTQLPVCDVFYDTNGGYYNDSQYEEYEEYPYIQEEYPYIERVVSGETITLSDGTGFTHNNYNGSDGYVVSSWNTEEDGTGTSYALGASFTYTPNASSSGTESLYLYAQWTQLASYTVSFDVNGGSGTVSSKQAYDGSSITLPSSGGYYSISKYNCTFNGWNTSSDGTGTHYDAYASYTVTGDVLLYAEWTEIVQISENVYVGVVAFNNDTSEFALSNKLGSAKIFIHGKNNDVDSTALCYAVSRAAALFGADDLPAFDNTFIVSFTDGNDNSSGGLYTGIAQGQVYDKAHTDLSTITGLKSYAIGFGSSLDQANMAKLVTGGGVYRTATSSNLDQVFQDIARSVLASSKNIELEIPYTTYTEAYPLYFRITITAKSTSGDNASDTAIVKCKLVGTTLTIIEPNNSNITFDAPAVGTRNGNKINIPLNNFKYTKNGTDWYIESTMVETSLDDSNYREDSESASTSTSNMTKKIGVVLVLDCSGSLGPSFSSVQTSAKNFIDTLINTQNIQ